MPAVLLFRVKTWSGRRSMAPEVPPLQAVAGACDRSVKPSRHNAHNKCTGVTGAWRVPGRNGLKACFSRCISCDKCSFVSYDISAGVCSWFQQCPTLLQRGTDEANGPGHKPWAKFSGQAVNRTRGVPYTWWDASLARLEEEGRGPPDGVHAHTHAQ